MTAPETAGQGCGWDEWYDADHASRTMAQDFNESKYDAMHRAFHAGAQAAIAAAAPVGTAAPGELPATMLRPISFDDSTDENLTQMHPTLPDTTQAAPELAAAMAALMDELAANYPEDVFPASSDSRDAISGTAMRHAYRTAARLIRERTGDQP